MLHMMSWMPSMRNARRVHYVYTAGVFAAVCVVADLLVSCLSQLSDAQMQNTLFVAALSVSAFVAGSANAGRKETRAKAVPAKKFAVPAKKPVQTKGAAREGEHEARQAAKRLVKTRSTTPTAPPAQANPTAEPSEPAEPQPSEPQPAESAVERGASHAAQAAEPQPEPPQKPLKAPRYASRSSAGTQALTEREDATSESLEEKKTGQSDIDPRVIEHPRQQGVGPSMLDMPECVRNNDSEMALKLFEQVLKKEMGCDYEPAAMPEDTRSSFFALVAGQLGDERLRKDGLQILAAVRAHGVQPPHVLQNRLVSAWGGQLPEQVLEYFTKMREEGVALSSAACRCIMADVVGLAGGKACPSPVDAAVSQGDPARDGAEEEGGRREEPDVVPHAATERTRLRREASTFVPKCWEGPWQMQPEVSMLCSWVHRPPPGLCDELPQEALQQMGDQCDECTTVILRNLPCPFLRDNLIAAMDAKGFAGLYNFVYVPVDFKTEMGLGYAFVNLVAAEEVQRFALAFNGFRDWPRASAKICAVDMSRTQGLNANVERYRNSPVMGEEVPERFRPVLFNGTQRVPFPEPTRELPRVFHKSNEW